jgi:hypothetical protein
MAHNVFISYASPDKQTADAVCAKLEQGGARCWIAPRDVRPGCEWPAEIANAIPASSVVVLVFSSHANKSEQIRREINIAASSSKPIIPFRIENVQPIGSLLYYIADRHWLDALTPELEKGLSELADTVGRLIDPLESRDARVREFRQDQYRSAVVIAWSDEVLSPQEMDSLNALAISLELEEDKKLEIERQVMGETVSSFQSRRPRPYRSNSQISERIPMSDPGRNSIASSQNTSEDKRKPANPEQLPAEDDSSTQSSSYCRKCGAQLRSQYKFCKKCGSSVAS